MNAHSAAVCQWSSRTPPAVSLMFTPAMDLEIAISRMVTSRDHPPFCIRLWPKAKGYLNVCTPPASVGGGSPPAVFCASSMGFVGPGSLLLRSASDFADPSCGTRFAIEFTPAAASAPELTSKNPRRENFPPFTSSAMIVPPWRSILRQDQPLEKQTTTQR